MAMLGNTGRAVLTLSLLGPPQLIRVQNVQPAWVAGTAYREGDLVTYVGVTYVCLRAHTAQAGREPPAAPDLWRVFSGSVTEAPAVPQGLAAAADGVNRIVVSWSQVPGATAYDLQADGVLVAGITSPHVHRGLAPGSTHVYRVRSVNDAGSSAWSETVACATDLTSGK